MRSRTSRLLHCLRGRGGGATQAIAKKGRSGAVSPWFHPVVRFGNPGSPGTGSIAEDHFAAGVAGGRRGQIDRGPHNLFGTPYAPEGDDRLDHVVLALAPREPIV